MRNYFIIICLCLLTSATQAQKFKYGKVSKEELEGIHNPEYPEASATVLYREYKTYFEYQQSVGFTRYIDVFERIKIHDPKGFEWGTSSIELRDNIDINDKLVYLNGMTYTLEDGSVEKVKLRNDGIFEKRASKYRNIVNFTMPNLKPGCIIEYEYRIASPFYYIGTIDLQYTIPINYEKIDIAIPEYFIYQNHSNPQSGLSFTFEKDTKQQEINFRAKSGLGTVNYGNDYAATQPTKGGTVTYKENVYRMEEQNIPPLKEEVFVDNLSNYQAQTLWELALINYPNEVPETFSTTWENVVKSIYENDDFINQIKRNDYYESEVASVTAGLEDPMEKMMAILSLVKSKVKWNHYNGYFPEKGGRKAFADGEGNSGDINLMLISMLQSANLNANPVLVSTRTNGIPVFPTRDGFNYVIAAVEYNGSYYLLDATDPFSSANLLPQRVMNWQGRIIRPDGTSATIGLYPPFVSQKLTYVQAQLIDGELQAEVNERLGGHFAREYRTRYFRADETSQKESVQLTSDMHISELQYKDLDNTKSNMSMRYLAKSTEQVEEINGELYISPMLFFASTENPFKDENRTYPIFFEYPKSSKYTINFKIPEGYKVASLPQGAKVNLANNMGSYTYLLQENAGTVQVSVSLDINTPIVLSQDYEFVKSMFSEIVNKEKEKMVLTKI